ncbi:MAG: hypothetical protein CMP20_01660 [Rickettsiales bacterium]|nr:hypothetical protein [Rickettsiales bacterium]
MLSCQCFTDVGTQFVITTDTGVEQSICLPKNVSIGQMERFVKLAFNCDSFVIVGSNDVDIVAVTEGVYCSSDTCVHGFCALDLPSRAEGLVLKTKNTPALLQKVSSLMQHNKTL